MTILNLTSDNIVNQKVFGIQVICQAFGHVVTSPAMIFSFSKKQANQVLAREDILKIIRLNPVLKEALGHSILSASGFFKCKCEHSRLMTTYGQQKRKRLKKTC